MAGKRKRPELQVHVIVPDLTKEERGQRLAEIDTAMGLSLKKLGHPKAQKFTYCEYDAEKDIHIYHFEP